VFPSEVAMKVGLYSTYYGLSYSIPQVFGKVAKNK
jgi:hypothetical protein